MGFNLDKFLSAYEDRHGPAWEDIVSEGVSEGLPEEYGKGYLQAIKDMVYDITNGAYDD